MAARALRATAGVWARMSVQQQLDGEGKLMRCMPFFTRDSAASRIDVIKVLQHTPAAAGAQVVLWRQPGAARDVSA